MRAAPETWHYTQEVSETSTIPAFDDHALEILRARYLLRDAAGTPTETPRAMLRRVADAVAQPESQWGEDPAAWADRFDALLTSLRFLPNSPTLMNAGKPAGQLSACFVLPVGDSLDAIFDSVKQAAQIHQTGGGTGFAFSRLRPRDDTLGSGGRSSGPVAFMRVFDAATAAVHQGGVRRGANMGILRVDHPDVLQFIAAKHEAHELNHFNISVAITDPFMAALEAGASYDLINPRSGQATGSLPASQVWDAIVRSAWQTGDPGLVFIDRINAAQPTPDQGPIESTNPCGELPLLPYESCNLGSIDVAKHLTQGGFDWDALRETIQLAARFLDDVIDANRYPLQPIHDVTHRNRKIGLGVMGWADALIELGIPYASDDAVALADELMGFVLREARATSHALAQTRGPFPAWEGSRWQREGLAPLRNATVTTIAPTGTISLLAGCSSGIEPLYAVAYQRRALDGEALLNLFHPALERLARARDCWSEGLRERVVAQGTLAGLDLPADLVRLFETAGEIPARWHVTMQAAFQRHVENSVSKTINLPHTATEAEVAAAYRLAWELGCKGITVYRDGSKASQVLSTTPREEPPPPFCLDCGP